jgi:hypothetical protein
MSTPEEIAAARETIAAAEKTAKTVELLESRAIIKDMSPAEFKEAEKLLHRLGRAPTAAELKTIKARLASARR